MQRRRFLVLMAGTALLGGCGFHLPGGSTIPTSLQGLRVEASGPAGGQLAQAVERALERDGNVASAQGPVLRLDNVYNTQRAISISPSSGAALEFLNTLRGNVWVQRGKKILLPAEPLLVEQSFTYNSGSPLATNEQQIESQRQLFDEAARVVLRRVLLAPALR
ncbi:LPS assembly lipoprotein LptE [Acidithiobacillus sp. AMEEHan]|uniref:LPS-assembly lipoprotein LptE n=1 Tax=Acidithiobacillus sp. AMEEHan TaxID=2994951 RepID=UPI0027E4CB10|nr:LPS assembly lipoprotein LptE [Acidithiobacillus sp. AMEEHan]